MGVITRSILNGLVLAVLVTVALLTTTGYIFLTVGARSVERDQAIARSRGVELGVALATVAAEKFDRETAVRLSSIMERVVWFSRVQDSDFVVDEIMMLGASGDLMAHNDVALLASGAEKKFDEEKYSDALHLPSREPFSVEAIEKKSYQGIPLYNMVRALSPKTGDSLGNRFPEKITTRTHISVAVYPVDQELPAGSVHIFATHKSANRSVEALRQYSVETLTMVGGFIFLITFIMTLLMSLSFRESDAGPARRGPASHGGAKKPRGGKSIVLDTPEPEDATAAGLAAPKREPVALHPRATGGSRRAPLPGPLAPAHNQQIFDTPVRAQPVTPPETTNEPYVAGAPDDAGYRDAHDEDFFDDHDDSHPYEDVYDIQHARAARTSEPQAARPADGPPPHRYYEDEPAYNPYETPGAYRPGPRILDAIPLDNFSRNKAARPDKRSRL